MFSHKLNGQIELQLIQHQHGRELFEVMDANRKHLRPWHPWVDRIRSTADLDRSITGWLQQFSLNRGFHAGIWREGKLCGAINHLNIDWLNRSTWLSFWLDEAHQGRGIMTAACRAFVSHAFNTLGLNRVTIECASTNARSRRIPERLGFKFEGISRGVEWLHDHYADHAIYGLLKGDRPPGDSMAVTEFPLAAPRTAPHVLVAAENGADGVNDSFSHCACTADRNADGLSCEMNAATPAS
jgi:ribosomal-protein-serine acetyltransferase